MLRVDTAVSRMVSIILTKDWLRIVTGIYESYLYLNYISMLFDCSELSTFIFINYFYIALGYGN